VSYIVLRGRWCNIIVLNVHAPSEEKSDEAKDGFYEHVAYEIEYCIRGVLFHIVYGALLIARLMCSVLYTLLCYCCILWAIYVRIIRNDSLYPNRCPLQSPPCDYSSRWDTVTRGTRFRSKRTLDGNQPPLPSARPGCCIWGLVAAHGPPVALLICLCACISARLFGLPRVLGTVGLCYPR